MIIDCHAHVVAPDSLYAFRSQLIASAGLVPIQPKVTDKEIVEATAHNISLMDEVGTDIQLISPRPFVQMHSTKPASVVFRWIAVNNDLIARVCALHPTRFYGVAGLPLAGGAPVESCLEELRRAVNDLGFVGVSLNPDPYEGQGFTPPMGDRFWYPLYEAAVELEVPLIVHSAGCFDGRESYSQHFITEESTAALSLASSTVFSDFPELRVVISHGGGSVPYQIGRWEAERATPALGGSNDREAFVDSLRRLWFDTVLHRSEALDLLFKVVGVDRCVFGTERPGSGSGIDRRSGRPYDDIKATIEEFALLDEASRRDIYESNPLSVFPRLARKLQA